MDEDGFIYYEDYVSRDFNRGYNKSFSEGVKTNHRIWSNNRYGQEHCEYSWRDGEKTPWVITYERYDESEDLMDFDTFFKDDNGKWTFITNENRYFLNYCLRKQPNNN